jgi:integrase
MRRSELLGARWKAIDFGRGLLAIRQVLVKVGGKGEFKEAPNPAHGFRTIQIAPRVLAVLRNLRRKQAEVRLQAQVWHDNDLVFCRPDGNPWHPDHVTETVREMIEASGLPRIRPLQDLRHTHATLLLADGENAKVVQERLGHHSHSFTADTYQHVMPGMDAAAASRFDGLVFGNDDDQEDEPDEMA